MSLTAIILNCTLKPSRKRSSTDRLLRQVADCLKRHDVASEIIRIADHNVKPGVTSDEGRGDAWPRIHTKILACDILIVGTPIWVGQPSSLCKRVIERLNAFLDEKKNGQGNMMSYGRVAGVAVVGKEDGAHHVSAEVFQALNDVGFTIPPNALTYWVGAAMGEEDYMDLGKTPRVVEKATRQMVSNLVHLAQRLKGAPYPSPKAR